MEQMQLLVMRIGPAAVGIDISSRWFDDLRGPFLESCGTRLNHAVLLVGWDEKYWIIKNSFGPSWGIAGYLHLPREPNKCGIQKFFGVPFVNWT